MLYLLHNDGIHAVVWLCVGTVGSGDLRISGGGSSGLLEFRQNYSTWGYVCIDGFDSNAARVACRQLGYTSGSYQYNYNNW